MWRDHDIETNSTEKEEEDDEAESTRSRYLDVPFRGDEACSRRRDQIPLRA